MSQYDYAKLRPVEPRPLVHQGQAVFYLRDPLELSPHLGLVPQYFGPVLAVCDGKHTVAEIQQIIVRYTGLFIPQSTIEQLLAQLDRLYLLDNARADEAKQQALAAYRAAPYRKPAIAGQSYPADAEALRRTLRAYVDQVPPTEELETGHGLISPHIDYYRGGPVYAQVWKRVASLAREAECAIFLGTDHNSSIPAQITLTRQDYATPFGVLPTNQEVVEAVAEALGEEAVFLSELHHRKEWSVELAAVWFHFVRDGEPCPIVPILCGSFQHFINNGHRPADDERLLSMVEAIQKATAGQKVLVVAAGDLAHIGPAFNGRPVDLRGRAKLQEDDNELLEPVFAGDADGFFEIIRQERDSRNVCGTSSIYLALKLMGQSQGEMVSYDRCPADEQETSFVSVCGVVFT